VIVYKRIVEQTVHHHERATFAKELVVTSGKAPLAIVRKRLAGCETQTLAPVLLVHGFGQNRYAWHLPSRSVSAYLARAGFDVFNLDLRGHGRSRHFSARTIHSVDDYITEDLPAAIDAVRKHSDGRPVFLVGHSLGGLVSYAAAPRLQGAVAGVASIGSPYEFTRGSRSLRALSVCFEGLRRARIPHVSGSASLYPVGQVLRSIRRVAESALYPIPIRGWHAGALEAHVLEEHLRFAFDHAGITELRTMFEWAADKKFGGRARDYADTFEQMDLPLLVIAGEHDDLAPPASVEPAYARSRSRDKSFCTVPFGHIDLLVGRDAPATTWATLTAWLTSRAKSGADSTESHAPISRVQGVQARPRAGEFAA